MNKFPAFPDFWIPLLVTLVLWAVLSWGLALALYRIFRRHLTEERQEYEGFDW